MNRDDFYREARPGSHGPLEGVRVLEATNYAAGPVCGMILCDLGAESIKCEVPGRGDPNRTMPPKIDERRDLESSTIFASLNRGKRSITLDFRQEEGQALFRRLAARADIVIENFAPGTMAAWGLGYEDLRAVKPDVIYVSLSGFGQWGPWAHRRGFDPVGQAMGGLMSITGEPDGRPLRAGPVIADDMSGWQGAIGALAALHHRSNTGEGQWVETSLTDAVLYASSYGVMAAANADYVWRRMGNSLGIGAPVNSYRCADGRWLCVFAIMDGHWRALCRVMGRDELIDDERTADIHARTANAAFIDEVVGAWLAERSAEAAQAELDAAGVVSAPVLGFDEIVEVEHYRERETVVEVEHPEHGPLTHFGVAAKLSRTPGRIRAAAPRLGEHNEAVYCGELGLSAQELAALRERGVV